MATNPRASEATRLHWRAQQQVKAQTRTAMRNLWPLLLANLESTGRAVPGQNWLAEATAATLAARVLSTELGGRYFRTFALLETGRRVDFTPSRPTPDFTDAIRESLRSQGPIMRTAMRSRGLAANADTAALRAVEESAIRHALDGGREAVVEGANADGPAKGWRRIPNGDSCPFCLMLIDRGGIYARTSVRFAAHDRCNCLCEPAYDDGPTVGVIPYIASKRNPSDADRKRVRDWFRDNEERLRAEHLAAT